MQKKRTRKLFLYGSNQKRKTTIAVSVQYKIKSIQKGSKMTKAVGRSQTGQKMSQM